MSAVAVWGRVGACPERSRREPSRPGAARQEGVVAGDSPARIALNPRGRSLIGQSSDSKPQALKRHISPLDGTTKVVPFPSRRI